MQPKKNPQEIIKDYFNTESDAYCAYYDSDVKLQSLIRTTSRILFQKAIHGRRDAVVALCPEPLNKIKICEVGCGGGHYSVELAKKGVQILGLDFAPKMIDRARELAKKEGVEGQCRFEQADIFNFNTSEKFDVVFAAGVIDYVPPSHHQKLIQKMASLSNKYIIVSFPKKYHYHGALRKVWLTLKGVPVWLFGSEEMTKILQSGGTIPDKTIDVGVLKVIRARCTSV